MKSKNTKSGRKAKQKNKIIKKRANKKRVSSLSAKKRRGRELYDIDIKSGYKDKIKLDEIIDNAKIRLSEFPDEQVKITMIAKKGKKKASMSFIYDLESGTVKENSEHIKFAMKDMLSDIFAKKTEREKTKSWQRIQPIKNYITKMIIDFETND